MGKDNWDRDRLHFTRKARKGMFFLLGCYIIIAILPRIYDTYIKKPPVYNIEISYMDPLDEEERGNTLKYNIPEEPFDPNSLSKEDWIEIGLSERQATSILKYLSTGAVLRVKNDVKKLYPIDDDLYSQLEPMIALPDEQIKSKKNYGRKDDNDSKVVEKVEVKEIEIEPMSINRASIEELQTIKGVGPFFAKEIVEMRERYGGILAPEQLLSIYKLDQEKLDEIAPYLIFDKSEIHKININTATELILKKHPLISSDMAKSIVYLRSINGLFKSLDELLLSPYIDSKRLKELKPYLTIE